MLTGGFVAMYRSITEWRWYQNIKTKHLYEHLILTCNWEDKPFEDTVIKAGQRVASILSLAKETGLTVNEVRTALKHLELTNDITSEATTKYTVFTVQNWDKYQIVNKQFNEQLTNESQTINKQITNESQQLNNITKQQSNKATTNYTSVRDLFNEICVSLPKVKQLSDTRVKKIKSLHEYLKKNDTSWEDFFTLVEQSDFLTGRDGRWSNCGFDWLLEPRNYQKVLEGNYTNKPKTSNTGQSGASKRGSVYTNQNASYGSLDDDSKYASMDAWMERF